MNLYEQAQRGDADALSHLVRRHSALVAALSRRYRNREDAFQQGCLGLVKAIRAFQPDRGFQFSTYAVPVILGEMRRGQSSPFGWRTRGLLNRARRYAEDCLQTTGRSPTVQDMARHTGLEPAELMLLMELDQPPQYDETGALLPSIPDPRGEGWLIRFFIRDILDRLPTEENWLLRQRFLLGRSQTQLARYLRLSQPRLSRREKQARQHFRRAWEEEN